MVGSEFGFNNIDNSCLDSMVQAAAGGVMCGGIFGTLWPP